MIEHGDRVAYIIYKMLSFENKRSQEEIIDICTLGILHDIGAYKTEEIDHMVEFETKNVWSHSIYGYLFVKNISPLGKLSDAILYHHLEFDKFSLVKCNNKFEASIIHLADRVDILMQNKGINVNNNLFYNFRDKKFSAYCIDLFINSNYKYNIVDHLLDNSYRYEVLDLFNEANYSFEQICLYLKMLIYSIDFRSEVTVTHTITMASISVEISKILNLSQDDITKIYFGALLHDLGKIAIPVSVLEKPGGLDYDEMNIMKSHVTITENILKDYIDDEIYEIAVRHHEKIDGSGYPHKLKGDELSVNQRIVAIADIISALYGVRSYKKEFKKEEIIKILKSMIDTNKICAKTTNIFIENYDLIMNNSMINCKDVLDTYNNIKDEYVSLYDRYVSKFSN